MLLTNCVIKGNVTWLSLTCGIHNWLIYAFMTGYLLAVLSYSYFIAVFLLCAWVVVCITHDDVTLLGHFGSSIPGHSSCRQGYPSVRLSTLYWRPSYLCDLLEWPATLQDSGGPLAIGCHQVMVHKAPECHEIMMLVCLKKDAKQCCDLTMITSIHYSNWR